MEVNFHLLWQTDVSSPQHLLLQLLTVSRVSRTVQVQSAGNLTQSPSSFCACILALIKHGLGTLQCLCQWLHKCYVDKSTSWCTKQPLSANDFARFVSEYGLWYLLFCKIGFATKFLISPAAFHLCGLRKVRRIEFLFLPLDWIYYFILEVTAKEYCIILISHRPCPVN